MSNQMNENSTFAKSLDGWATLPAAAVEALETWKAATGTLVDSPVGGLRADAFSGAITAKNVTARLVDAGQLIAAQVVAPQLVAELDGPLAQRFADAVLADGDRIIGELAQTFDKYATAYITKYAPLVPPNASAEELLSTANADVLAAWQNLAIAETTLEQVASIRLALTTRYNYEAPSPGICAWIGPVGSEDEIRRAALTWRGLQPIGDADSGATASLPEVRGGRWRWLVEAGFTLACNDRHQAAAVAAPLAASAAAAAAA